MRLLTAIAVAVAAAFASVPALAADAVKTAELGEALGLPEIVRIMRAEGLDYGAEMQEQLFPGRGGSGWTEAVKRIYDPEVMEAAVTARLAADLDDEQVATLLEFFASERGRTIISFEVSAREALLDPDIEAAAETRLAELRADEDPRLDLVARFVEANDLVESNVMGAMNSNYAFYQGLVEGDAFPGAMTENDILADVWSQEDQIRFDTEQWVYAYLSMAYQPLSDADLEAYIAISETPSGRSLNRALFEGFDDMYVAISGALGLAAARFMGGQDI